MFVHMLCESLFGGKSLLALSTFMCSSLSMDYSHMGNQKECRQSFIAGVSILMSYGENPHYVKLPIFSEFMENSTKFMKNSDLTKWTQNLR